MKTYAFVFGILVAAFLARGSANSSSESDEYDEDNYEDEDEEIPAINDNSTEEDVSDYDHGFWNETIPDWSNDTIIYGHSRNSTMEDSTDLQRFISRLLNSTGSEPNDNDQSDTIQNQIKLILSLNQKKVGSEQEMASQLEQSLSQVQAMQGKLADFKTDLEYIIRNNRNNPITHNNY